MTLYKNNLFGDSNYVSCKSYKVEEQLVFSQQDKKE